MLIKLKKQERKPTRLGKFAKYNNADYYDDEKDMAFWVIPKSYGERICIVVDDLKQAEIRLFFNNLSTGKIFGKFCPEEQEWIIKTLNEIRGFTQE